MKSVRIISSILYYLVMLFAVLYLVTGLYVIIARLFNVGAFAVVGEGKYFEIYYPFSKSAYLRGDNNTFYIVEMILILLLYGIFFWSLANVFKSFRQQKIFTRSAVKRLTIFYLLNFIVPLLFLLVHIAVKYEVDSTVMLVMLHGVLGVFAYFMTAIFKQGLKLQNEQDLFI